MPSRTQNSSLILNIMGEGGGFHFICYHFSSGNVRLSVYKVIPHGLYATGIGAVGVWLLHGLGIGTTPPFPIILKNKVGWRVYTLINTFKESINYSFLYNFITKVHINKTFSIKLRFLQLVMFK